MGFCSCLTYFSQQPFSAFDIVFVGTFASSVMLTEFENDSFHKSIGELVGSFKQERIVVDYEV